MSEHDTACTCDRCRMMVMPTSRTVSGDEKVLYEWTDAIGDKFRMIDGPRPMGIGFLRSAAESDWEWRPVVLATTDAGKAILSLLCETRRLAALFDGEKILRARDTARVAELEAREAKLRECVEAADVIRRPQFLGDDWMVKQRWHAALDTYDRVRAEVDK